MGDFAQGNSGPLVVQVPLTRLKSGREVSGPHLATFKGGICLLTKVDDHNSAFNVHTTTVAKWMGLGTPDEDQLGEWVYDSVCEALDGCTVEPDGVCEHKVPSWLLAMGLI